MRRQQKASPEAALPYAIITGGSEGIGAAFAHELASRATHNIILVARNVKKLDDAQKDIEQRVSTAKGDLARNFSVQSIALDLAAPNAAQALQNLTKDLPVTLLILNAGTAVAGPFEDQDWARTRTMNDLNVVGLTEVIQTFLPRLKKEARVRAAYNSRQSPVGLVTLSSIAGLMPVPAMAAYAAGKAYVLSLTESIHHEQRVQGTEVHVTCVLPGPTRSALWSLDGGRPSKVLVPWTSAQSVARAGIDGFMSNTAVVIPGVHNNITAYSLRLAPKWLIRRISSLAMNQWPDQSKTVKSTREHRWSSNHSATRPTISVLAAAVMAALLFLHGFPSLLSSPSSPYRWIYRRIGWMGQESTSFPFLLTFREADDRLFLEDRVQNQPTYYRWGHAIPAFIWTCCVPLQHSPRIRARFPSFHKMNGYVVFSISALLMTTGLGFLVRGTSHSEKGLLTVHHVPGHPWLIYPTFDQDLLLVTALQAPTLLLSLQAARRREFARHQYWATMFTIASYIIHLDRLGFTLIFLIGGMLQHLPLSIQARLPESIEDKMRYELMAFSLSALLGGIIGLAWAFKAHRSLTAKHGS
ncbi:17 beta-hydroxysteroid dehydrogenase type 3, HSD17B3 [Ceraceosorus bombacis]|uniref:17 beta-hydroxysteroid dehydrogenase type 3, HSD17B3 n=1 Tax=Ceraceosorus bombacis TaxID=401625 RepID=A0A0P1B9W9_9BASI|nr:17 beta-hydroxysteroid dehydrogenase type 3, HSD17B3 [Ceraceosorus bombacis]